MAEKIKFDISFWTIAKILLTIVLFLVLYNIRDILALVFVSLILVAALRPTVNKWGSKVGRSLAITALLIILILLMSLFIYIIVPPFVEQTKQLVSNLPDYLEKFSTFKSDFPSLQKWIDTLTQNLGNITGSFVSFTSAIFGGLVGFFTLIVLTFYLLADQNIYKNLIKFSVSESKRKDLVIIFDKVSQKIGDWVRGQLILGLIVGTISYIGLEIIGIPYALTLAVIAGLLEILPVVGPIISGILAVLVALTVSPIVALFVLIFYVALQQIENNLLVPKIMQKAVGLPPAIVIIAILIGGQLLGLVGAILAVPIAAILYVLADEWERIREIISKDAK